MAANERTANRNPVGLSELFSFAVVSLAVVAATSRRAFLRALEGKGTWWPFFVFGFFFADGASIDRFVSVAAITARSQGHLKVTRPVFRRFSLVRPITQWNNEIQWTSWNDRHEKKSGDEKNHRFIDSDNLMRNRVLTVGVIDPRVGERLKGVVTPSTKKRETKKGKKKLSTIRQ